MVRQSWLQRLLRGHSKSSATAARKRPAFSPVKLELLEDRTTPTGADLWANATAIPQGNPWSAAVTFNDPTNNSTYTLEAGEPSSLINNPSTHSAWWKTSVVAPGTVTIDTFGTGGAAGDTTLEVFTGAAVNALSVVVFNDDTGGGTGCCNSRVVFQATVGTNYYVRLNGFDNGSVGLMQFNYSFVPTLQTGNNAFANAISIPPGYPSAVVNDAYDNTGFTMEVGEPDNFINAVANGGGTHSAWYQATVASPGNVVLDTFGTVGNASDTTLEVFLALSSPASVDQLAILNDPTYLDNGGDVYNDDRAGHGVNSSVNFRGVPGTTYYIRLSNWNNPSFGPSLFHYSYTADPQTVTSIARQTPAGSITNANSVTFLVTFGQDSQNVGAADFTTTFGTIGTVTPITASQYAVQVNGLNAVNGTVALALAANTDIQSTSGYALTTRTPTGAVESYTIDHIAPSIASIVRQNPSVTPATASDVTFRITFSEDAAVSSANFSASTGTLGAVVPVGGATHAYDVPISGLGAFTGTLTLSIAGPTIQDLAGNNVSSNTPTGANQNTYFLNPLPANFTLPVAGTYTLSRTSGTTAQLKNAGNTVVFSYDIALTADVNITGTAGDDTLVVDFGNGSAAQNPLTSQTLNFAGGANGAGGDKLKMTNTGAYGHVAKTFFNTNDGKVVFGGTSTVSYTGLEPVDMTGSTITDLVLNLPAGVDNAILEDVGTNSDGLIRIRSTGGSFETFSFPKPTGSLTINTDAGDTVTVNVLDTTFSPTSLNVNTTGGTSTLALGASDVIPNGTRVGLVATAFNLGGFSDTIGSLDGNVASSLNYGGATSLTVGGDGTTSSFDGAIGAGAGALTKVGAGAMTISGAITMSGGQLNANGGTLAILNTANVINAASSLNIPAGGAATINVAPASSVGDAQINVTGGILNVGQIATPSAPGLYIDLIDTDGFFHGPVTPSGAVTNAIGAGLANGNVTVFDDLNPAGISYWITPGGSQDTMTYVYQGQFFDADGIFSFGENIDDTAIIRIDGVQYLDTSAWNTPETTSTLRPSNNYGMGAAGDGWHDIDIRLGEFGGGAGAVGGSGWSGGAVTINGIDYPAYGFGVSIDGTGGANGALNIPVDTAQPGIQVRHLLPVVNIAPTNAVSVSGSSTVNMLSGLIGGATFPTLTMAAGASLAVNAAFGGQTLKFTGTATLAGSETLNIGTGASLRLAGQVAGAGGFTKEGAGAVYLDNSANNYAGATVVNAGVVFLGANNALGSTAVGTTVNNGGQVAVRANYNAAEPIVINGNTTAAIESNGNFNFNGPISMASSSTIQASAGTLTLNGGIATNGNELTTSGAGTVTVATVGVTGTGSLKRAAGGDTNMTAANGFTGGTNIESGGRVLFTVDSGTGAIHVLSGGSLIYTGATDLIFVTSVITLDSGANIASRNARFTVPTATLPLAGTLIVNKDNVNDNYVIFPNAFALTEDFDVQVGGGTGNGGVGVFAGVVSGGFGFIKTGNGILALANNNTYTGTNTALAGVLAAAAPNAFGTTAGGTVVSVGASLGLAGDPAAFGDFTLNAAEPITLPGGNGAGGIGALVNLQGNNTFNNVLAPFGIATTIGSLSGTMTLNSNLGNGGGLTFNGAGNIAATGIIADAAPTPVPYAFVGFTGATGGANSTQDILNWTYTGATTIDQSGGFAANALTLNGSTAIGGTLNPTALELTSSINGQTSSAWQAVTPSAFTSHFQFQFSGLNGGGVGGNPGGADGFTFTIQNVGLNALGGGGGALGYEGIGNSLSVQFNMWNGVTEFGVARNGVNNKSQVNLAAERGYNFHSDPSSVFDVVVVYNGSSGGSVAVFDFTNDPTGANAYILPFDFNPAKTVTKTGTGTTTLSGANTYTFPTVVNGGILSAATNGALGTTAVGTKVNSGGTLQFANVAYANLEPVTLAGTGALVGSGTSSFAGPINTPPTVLFANHQTVQPSPDVSIPVGGVVGRYVRVQQNLPNGQDGWLSLAEVQVFDVTATNVAELKPASQTSEGFGGAASRAVDGNTDGNYGSNSTTHSGSPDRNNWWQVDLGANFAIDSIAIWNRTDCCQGRLRDYYVFVSDVPFANSDTIESLAGSNNPSIGTVAVADSLTLSGPITINSFSGNPSSVTFNGSGSVTANGVIGGGGSVNKSGTGSATFGFANTYAGNTTVTGGTLNTAVSNALGSSFTTSTLRVSGASSVVNLFNNAAAETKVGTANFFSGQGTVNTGAGKLHVANVMTLAGGYSITGDFTAVGANLINNSVQRTLTEVTGAMNITRPPVPLTISMVDSASPVYFENIGNNTGPSTIATTFTVTGGNVLVVEVGGRDNAATPPTVTWNGVALTQAAFATHAPNALFSRDVSIFYLYNPTPAVGAALVVDTPTSGQAFITAFTLANVDVLATPIVATSSSTTAIAPPTAINGVFEGSWMVVAEAGFAAGGNPPITVTWSAAGAPAVTPLVNFNSQVNTYFSTGVFQTVGPDNYSIVGTQTDATGLPIVKANRAVVAFKPAGNPFSLIDLPATNVTLPTGTSLQLNVDSTAVLGNVSLGSGTTVVGGVSTPTGLTVNNISGIGTVNLPLTVAGEASPGLSPGILNAAGGVGLRTGGSLKVEINGIAVGTGYDQLNVTGAVTLNAGGGSGATLNVIPGFAAPIGQVFTIIKGSGSAVSGTFNGLAEGSTFSAGGQAFRINYNVGATRDVTLTAVVVTATPPTVVGIPVINGGAAFTAFAGVQRSDVVSIAVTFDQPVELTFDPNTNNHTGAFQLAIHTNNLGLGTLPTIAATSTDNVHWTITFVGNTDPSPTPAPNGFASIRDGVYDFKVDTAFVHPLGVPGTSGTTAPVNTFHRLFGDANGDETPAGPAHTAIVAIDDNFAFRSAFNSVPNYRAYFDFDGDGVIGIQDNFQFRSRFNRPLTWTT